MLFRLATYSLTTPRTEKSLIVTLEKNKNLIELTERKEWGGRGKGKVFTF